MYEEGKVQYPLFICRECPRVGKRDVIMPWRKRCILCGRQTEKFEMDKQEKHGKKRKYPKGIQRFPRLLAANEAQQQVVELLEARTRDFDCPGKVTDIRVGPMVTEYEFSPDRFTRLWKIKNIHEDLAIALKAEAVSVQRLPGKAAVSVCVPNEVRKEVEFKACLPFAITHRDDMELPVVFGVTATGEPYVEDLVKMPHLLIGGSTGAGKSVWLNSILTSLLWVRSPKQLKLILIDPKSVELMPYKGLPHLVQDPVAGVYEALNLLDRMVQEMRRRTANLYTMKVKNVKQYNDKVKEEAKALKDSGASADKVAAKLDECWPYVVVVIDEMADLVLQEKKSFVEKMAAISAMSRAAGIHVIAATQRPSVDVLPGKIKVNFPARAAFRVPSAADSKTILGHKGAEQLLGCGDMFYVSPEKSGFQRLHAPHIKQEDINHMLKVSIELGHVLNVPADAITATPSVPIILDKIEGDRGNGKKSKTLVN